nr:homeodomain-like protein [Tanacetum cinerariifolium]
TPKWYSAALCKFGSVTERIEGGSPPVKKGKSGFSGMRGFGAEITAKRDDDDAVLSEHISQVEEESIYHSLEGEAIDVGYLLAEPRFDQLSANNIFCMVLKGVSWRRKDLAKARGLALTDMAFNNSDNETHDVSVGKGITRPDKKSFKYVEPVIKKVERTNLKIYVVSIMKAFCCIGTGIGFGGRLWMSSHDQYVESSKQSISQSGSHDGPLIIGTTYGTSTKGDNNMDMDDGENTKSDVFARSVNGGKWEVYPDVTAL